MVFILNFARLRTKQGREIRKESWGQADFKGKVTQTTSSMKQNKKDSKKKYIYREKFESPGLLAQRAQKKKANMAGFVEAACGGISSHLHTLINLLLIFNFISTDPVGYSSHNVFLLLILTESNTY